MSLLEYVNQLVVVPRICECCEQHPAVVLWVGTWPDTYYCRYCYELMEAQLLAAFELYGRHN